MKSRFTSGLALFVALTAGCGEILGEDFKGYGRKCTNGSGSSCAAGSAGISGLSDAPAGAGSGGIAGKPSVAGHGGKIDSTCDANTTCLDHSMPAAGEAGATGDSGAAGIAGSNTVGGATGLAGASGSSGNAGSSGRGGAGGFAGSTSCQPDAPVVPECTSFNGKSFPEVPMQAAQGIMMLSVEQFGGGFQVFASKRGSSLIAQLWSEYPGEQDWLPWCCFDSLPQPDRLAGHALLDGTLEVFATTLCGGLYRRTLGANGWDPWAQVSEPLPGQAVTDVAISESADDINIVYVAKGGHIFARVRLGTEMSSGYADPQEIPGVSNASLVSGGLRSDQRQQVFIVNANGAAFTAIQSTTALDAPFSAWSDFDTSQLPYPLVDIEAPLGGPLPLEVYAVDSHGTLWQRAQDTATGIFGPWQAWDGPPTPGPVLSLSGSGLKYATNTPLRLMVLTETRHVYTVRRTANVWGDWRLFP